MGKYSGATSDWITFTSDGIPMSQKDKSNMACFLYRVSGHYSTKNSCKQEYIENIIQPKE